MPSNEPASLREALRATEVSDARLFSAGHDPLAFKALRHGSSLGGRLRELAGKSVLIITDEQLAAALALIELDGVARRITICPPDVPTDHLIAVIGGAGVDAIVSDRAPDRDAALGIPLRVEVAQKVATGDMLPPASCRTEWVLMTSGTTGAPKLVVHSLAGLTGAIKYRSPGETPVVWGTFYDIRRYGGLQIFLRAVLGGASLVLSRCGEPLTDHLARLRVNGMTHMSGTPTHWRRLVMSSVGHLIAPAYVRLSGEIADQAILDGLRALYPHARIAHAYASTEAGVAFTVEDGREGVPASLIASAGRDVEMKVEAGTLRIRSPRTAVRYVGAATSALTDADGFVDTGDIVELRGDRYYFVGRSGGIINVGGLKVHPEEVEAIINRHPQVRMSLVHARKNPITGAIVVADVVLKGETPAHADPRTAALKREILETCQEQLPQHKVPAAIRFVAALDVAASGKLARRYA
jgi:acyl-coenzyme A synthetase/AMP-(fatty) acid ligase